MKKIKLDHVFAGKFTKGAIRLGILSLALFMSAIVYAQTDRLKVEGIVTDSYGAPIPGATIIENGTYAGTTTDTRGGYSIIVSGSSTLTVSSLGYETQQVPVNNRTNINIQMNEDVNIMDEVVVVGYGVQKKKLITGATVQVSGENVEKQHATSVLSALQGQTPGVNITKSSGMPGQGNKVVIRGIGTIANSNPLYIVDGSPAGSIDYLSPSDIESIDVLKDAASAAIYGARAANGVIIVTTKQGRQGKVMVTFDGYFGVQNVYRMPYTLNAQEYATIMDESRLMDGLAPYDFASMVPNWDKIQNGSFKGTNWLEESRNKNAPIQNYSVGITGGTEQSTYSIGFSYMSQEGIFGKPYVPQYDRFVARVNSEHVLYKHSGLDMIKFGENITYTYRENHGVAIGDMWTNDIRNLLNAHPFSPVYDDQGEYTYSIPWESRVPNPIGMTDLRNGRNTSKNHDLRANLFLTIEPLENLRFRSNFGYSMSASSYRSYLPTYDLSTANSRTISSVSQAMSVGNSFTWENTLNYTFSINESHNFDLLVGQAIESSGLGESVGASNGNPIFDGLKYAYINNAPLTALTGATLMSGAPGQRHKLSSFFGRVNYDYKNKYMFTAILRADGSSNFARNHRWGYFPSFSGGWVLSEESFMKPVSRVMDFLKIRASWGQNGNQAIAPFQYLATIGIGGAGANYFFNPDKTASIGSYPDIMPSPDLTWETSEQFDVGLDARFFGSRLGLAFDYYIKTTKDWLVVAPQLATNGTAAPYINGGDIRNKGYEVVLTWDDRVSRDFQYGANVNIAFNKNEVTRIANSEGIIHGNSEDDALFTNCGEVYRAQVGFPVGYFYGYKTKGIFQTPEEVANYKGAKLPGAREGDVIWVDRDGSGTITDADRGMIGNPHPKMTMGLGLNAAYKGFDISMNFYGAFGFQIMQSYRSWSESPKDNHTSMIFGRWHGPGTSNKLPRLTTQSHTNWRYVSDLYVQDGDYLRLQNLTIGYDFSKLFKSSFLSQLRLYFTAQNLFTITGYDGMDPEVGYGHADSNNVANSWVSGIDIGYYPSPRTYLLGINLKF